MDLDNTSALLPPPQQEEHTSSDPSIDGVLFINEAQKHHEAVESSRRNGDGDDDDDKEVVPERGFIDEENMLANTESTTSLNSSLILAVRARISDETEEEEEEEVGEVEEEEEESKDGVDEDRDEDMRSFTTIGSYESTLIPVPSSPEMESPVGSFSGSFPFSEASVTAQQSALKKLNELSTGIPSLNVSILENASEGEFRHRVMDIAVSKGLSLDDEALLQILDALVPLVRERIKRNKYINYKPVAKITIEDNDDDDIMNVMYDAEAYENEGEKTSRRGIIFHSDKLENAETLLYSAVGLPIREAEYEFDEQDELVLESINREEKTSNSKEGSDPKEPDTLDVIHGETDYEVVSLNMMRSLDENEHLVESHSNDSYTEKQLLDKNQSSNIYDKPELSGLSYEIQLNRIENYTGMTTEGVCQAALVNEATEGHGDKLLQSELPLEEAEDLNPQNTDYSPRIIADDNEEDVGDDHDHDHDDDDDGDYESFFKGSSPLDSFMNSSSSQAQAVRDMLSLGVARSPLLVQPRPIPSLTTRSSTSDSIAHTKNIDLSKGDQDTWKKLKFIRAKFLQLANMLGQSENSLVVSQVLYRLFLAEQLHKGQAGSQPGSVNHQGPNTWVRKEEETEQEQDDPNDLVFECTIMVLGKSGVGKSATINSLFGESKTVTNAYKPATKKVNVVDGTVCGVKLRILDTPGLLPSFADQRYNEKVMSSVKHFMKKFPPDIVLYLDRLDMSNKNYGDLSLLRIITNSLGSSIWLNAVVVLTHASSATPDGNDGLPISYDLFVSQHSHSVQQSIRQVAGDMRLMNPISLVENHASCQRDGDCQFVLPNGHFWKQQLLLLCFASKVLSEARSILKLEDNGLMKPFGVRPGQILPLPFFLSSMLQTRDDDYYDSETDSKDDDGDGETYDGLRSFHVHATELTLLDKEQRKLYYEQLKYREKLFMVKQLKEELAWKKRLNERERDALQKDISEYMDDELQEKNKFDVVPVPMPDMTLPVSFDSDNPTYRYRYRDTNNQWIVRPMLEAHGWDHDSGYDGLTMEGTFMISKNIPASLSAQISKDKKEGMVQMESNASLKIGKGKVSLTGLDIQTMGRTFAYTLRSETKFDNFKRNQTSCGISITKFGTSICTGMKLENQVTAGKCCKIVVNAGAIRGDGDATYGGSLDVSVQNKDYPTDQPISTLGLSLMNWRSDFAIGGNLQAQFRLGSTLVGAQANYHNRGPGKITIRVNSLEQGQMALIGVIPLLHTCLKRILSSCQTTL